MEPFGRLLRAGFRQLLAFSLLPLFVTAMHADVMTLTNQNSTVQLDPASQAGVYNWIIDGKNVVYQQWFWMRAGAATEEIPVDSSHLTLTGETAAGGHGLLGYAGSGYTVTFRFNLVGGGTGTNASDLSEIISLKNTSSIPLSLSFFQYANLEFSNGNDAVQFINPYSVQQTGGLIYLNETVVNPTGLVHHQADVYPNILNSLDDNSITNLDDADSASGDATWAFQWQQTLAPGGTFTITKDMNVSDPPPEVPEPQSFILLGTLITFVIYSIRKQTC